VDPDSSLCPETDVTGVILAGGRSRRMGTDKSLISFHGLPMIEHVANTLTSVFARVCIVADQPESFTFLGLRVIPDLLADLGPLGGIHAALTTFSSPRIFVVGCDMPFVSSRLVRHVVLAHRGHPVTVPREEERIQPLCAVYERRCLPRIEEFFCQGRRRLVDAVLELGCRQVPLDDRLEWYRPGLLKNLNTPEDLEDAGLSPVFMR
jgi:molybdenum cofactor guanylyltransferase